MKSISHVASTVVVGSTTGVIVGLLLARPYIGGFTGICTGLVAKEAVLKVQNIIPQGDTFKVVQGVILATTFWSSFSITVANGFVMPLLSNCGIFLGLNK